MFYLNHFRHPIRQNDFVYFQFYQFARINNFTLMGYLVDSYQYFDPLYLKKWEIFTSLLAQSNLLLEQHWVSTPVNYKYFISKLSLHYFLSATLLIIYKFEILISNLVLRRYHLMFKIGKPCRPTNLSKIRVHLRFLVTQDFML